MSEETILTIPDPKIMGNYVKIDFNDFKSFFIGTDTITESNNFLNSLWKNLNEKYSPNNSERCPWYYIPQKIRIKQLSVTYFGSMRTKIGYFHIAVSYKKKGSINNIHFLPFESKIDKKEIFSKLKALIKKSKKKSDIKFNYIVSCELIGKFIGQEETVGLLDYISDDYMIKDSVLKFSIYAQDMTDAKRIASIKLRNIMNFLAVETNLYFVYESLDIQKKDEKDENYDTEIKNIFQEDLEYDIYGYKQDEFIDFYPSIGGSTLLSKDGKEFIQRILQTDLKIQSNLNIFLNSCYHFREGIKQELLINNKHIFVGKDMYLQLTKKNQVEKQTIIDSTITHYLSSVETSTLIGFTPEKCESCGQMQYKITSRVYEFMSTYLDETLGNIFKKIYNQRSQYLHSGISYAKNQDTETRPLLDKNTGTGSIDYNIITLSIKGEVVGIGKENIREWTSYALRNFYKKSTF